MHRAKTFIIGFFLSLTALQTTTFIASSYEYLIINHPVYDPGMFCVLNTITALLYQYEQHEFSGVEINFEENGLYYDTNCGPNWWGYYFEPLSIGNDQQHPIKHFADTNCALDHFTQKHLSRLQVFDLIEKYIKVKPAIQDKLTEFVENKFKNHFIIGVHYRGTDKYKEAPQVSYETVWQAILSYIESKHLKKYKIFVATDEQNFVTYITEKFQKKIITQEISRSYNDIGLHLQPRISPFQIGEEALLDCLLLSKSHVLIRTDSRLSLWAAYFNPFMPVISLNTNYYLGKSPDGL